MIQVREYTGKNREDRMNLKKMPELYTPNLKEKMNTAPMEILWESDGEGGARILRVFGNTLKVRLPEALEGLPVTQIGAYCFSSADRLSDPVSTDLPAICGSYVEEVYLPSALTTLHNAAFYNCRKLRSLTVGKGIRGIGSDVFMNCVDLDHIEVRASCVEKTGLSLILERLISDVEVCFRPEDDRKECVLFFPEYYEWLNEISPAHVFSRSIEGEGFRIRRVFHDQRVDLGKYDQCFPDILKGESDRNICRIALNRLRWPVSLSGEAEERYSRAVKDLLSEAADIMIRHRDLEGLGYLCSRFDPSREELFSWMQEMIASEWGEGNAYLLEEVHKRSSFSKKRFILEDL